MKPLKSSMGIIPNAPSLIFGTTLYKKRYDKISLEFMKNVYDLLLSSDWLGKTE